MVNTSVVYTFHSYCTECIIRTLQWFDSRRTISPELATWSGLLTSRASPGSCWAPRCAGAGVGRPVSSAPLAPKPWRRSWAFSRAACSCFRCSRAQAWARGSSRSSWAPGSPPHGSLRGSARPHRRIWRTSSPPPCRPGPPDAAAAARGVASRPRQPHRRNDPVTGSDCRPTSRDWAQRPTSSAPLWTSSYTHKPPGAQMMQGLFLNA